MKKHFFGMLAAVCSGTVWAADFVDTAKVISSTPIYERVSEPKQECWTETISSTGTVTRSTPVEERSVGGALLGGLIGGVVGSQIGQGNGSTVATGAGAIAGAIIGDRVANKDKDAQQQVQTTQVPQTREERHCRQVENYREVIRGYDVTYRYNGKDISTRLPYQPGNTVKVSIGVVGDTSDDSASEIRDRHDARDVRDYRGDENRKYRKKDRRYDD